MKIICIGRNYAAHAKELNNPVGSEPVIFLKPDSAILDRKLPFFLPDFSDDIHHELEIVIKINRLGKNIEPRFAYRYFEEVTVGLDFTARDVQQKQKTKGLPWEIAKGFDGSAAVGEFIRFDQSAYENGLNFELLKNNESVQKGDTTLMLFPIPEIISYVSRFFTLKKGDLIFTGTPEGVGPVQKNDVLEGFLSGQRLLSVKIK